jgi:NAD kinase
VCVVHFFGLNCCRAVCGLVIIGFVVSYCAAVAVLGCGANWQKVLHNYLLSEIDIVKKKGKMSRSFRNILVVVKQTPYETYMQMKSQGKAPVALRWERLQNRYNVHRQCVDAVVETLKREAVQFSVIGRDELHRGLVVDKDLIITVGGDGTTLNASSFLDDTIPILGVNSDPTRPEERQVTRQKDERRSKGALCAMTATDVTELLPRVLHENLTPNTRTRIQCLVRSTYTETRLPPALNDILVAHPSPASVSRFRLALSVGNVTPSYKTVLTNDDVST